MEKTSEVQLAIRQLYLGLVITGLLLGGLWGGLCYGWYDVQRKEIVSSAKVEIAHHLEAGESHALNDLNQIIALLRALSMSHDIHSLLVGKPEKDAYEDLRTTLSSILSHMTEFRLLDETGMERLRMSHAGDMGIQFHAPGELVSRASSDCFRMARSIPFGSIYLAPLSTGAPMHETGSLKLPQLRIAMPIEIDDLQAGHVKGLMVIFIDGRQLFWHHVSSPLVGGESERWIDEGFVYRISGGEAEVVAQKDYAGGKEMLRKEKTLRLAGLLPLDASQQSLVWRFSESLPDLWLHGHMQVILFEAWVVWGAGSVWMGLLLIGMATSRRAALLADAERLRLLGEVKGLSQRLIAAHEDERSALARVLHDDIAQSLAAVQMRLGGLAQDCEGDGCDAANRVRGEEVYIGKVMDALRGQLSLLRPPQLDALGLRGALFGLLDEMQRLHAMEVDAQIDVSLDGLEGAQSMGIYRLVQEALSNIQRHAEASRVMLKLTLNSARIHLLIEDDGCGFDVSQKAAGFGIVGMREQVALLDGEMLLDSLPGGGTRLHVHMAARPGDFS